MIKKYFVFGLFFLLATFCNAQVSSYDFAQVNDVYIPINRGTVLGTTANNDEFFVNPANLSGSSSITTGIGFPIGFNFIYNGVVYDRFGVHTNGWISLGQFSLLTSVNMGTSIPFFTKTPLSDNTIINPPQLRNRISALGYDLQGQSGSEIRFETIGSAPNRVLVVQWKNYRQSGQSGQSYNFQIRLVESINHLYFIYGSTTFTSTFSTFNAAAEVGLGGFTNTDFNNRATNSTTPNWNTTTRGNLVTDSSFLRGTVPASGLLFWYKPSTLATDDFVEDEGLKIYPNPSTDCIKLDFQKPFPTKINIYDFSGKKILEKEIFHSGIINIQNFTSGIYTLEAQIGEKKLIKKIIKN